MTGSARWISAGVLTEISPLLALLVSKERESAEISGG